MYRRTPAIAALAPATPPIARSSVSRAMEPPRPGDFASGPPAPIFTAGSPKPYEQAPGFEGRAPELKPIGPAAAITHMVENTEERVTVTPQSVIETRERTDDEAARNNDTERRDTLNPFTAATRDVNRPMDEDARPALHAPSAPIAPRPRDATILRPAPTTAPKPVIARAQSRVHIGRIEVRIESPQSNPLEPSAPPAEALAAEPPPSASGQIARGYPSSFGIWQG